MLLTEGLRDEYLHYLQLKEILYIFAGKQELDFKSALAQLTELFPIEIIMLACGHIVLEIQIQ